MKAHRGNGAYIHSFLTLALNGLMVSFTLRPLTAGKERPPLNVDLGVTQSQYGRLGRNKYFLQLPEIELRFIDHHARKPSYYTNDPIIPHRQDTIQTLASCVTRIVASNYWGEQCSTDGSNAKFYITAILRRLSSLPSTPTLITDIKMFCNPYTYGGDYVTTSGCDTVQSDIKN